MDAPRKSGEFTFSARTRLSREEYACTAFTLVELLVVVAVMVLMMTLAIPAFNAIRGGGDFMSEVYNIAGTLNQARAYAVANNTYVLAGIAEVAGTQDTSANPQASGTGRVAMAVIASKSGMRPYQYYFSNPNIPSLWLTAGYGSGSIYLAVNTLVSFQNIHMVDLQYNGTAPVTLPASGNMARPALATYSPNGYYWDLSNANCTTNLGFGWPLGTKPGGSPAPQYTFTKVIEFDPQGCARVFSNNNFSSYPDAIPQLIEIELQPAHGAVAAGPPQSQSSGTGLIAAIQISGLTGAVHIYRP